MGKVADLVLADVEHVVPGLEQVGLGVLVVVPLAQPHTQTHTH